MLVYLDDYRKTLSNNETKEIDSAVLKNGTYGADVMNTTRKSATLLALHTPAQTLLSPELPTDLSTIDMDDFLSRVYALASQV